MQARLTWIDACARLRLPPEATAEQIKSRFREIAKKHHPDAFLTPADKANATVRFQPLAEAYSFLMTSTRPASPGTPRVSGQAPPPPDIPYSEPSSTVGYWSLLEPLKDSHPNLYLVLDVLFGPTVIYLAFTIWPWVAVRWLFPKSTVLDRFLSVICFRWAPILVTIFVGNAAVSKGIWWAWVFVVSGYGALLLELVAQVVGLARWRRLKGGLVRTLETVPHALDPL